VSHCGAPFSVVEDRLGTKMFCLFESVDLALPIDDEPESNTLDAARHSVEAMPFVEREQATLDNRRDDPPHVWPPAREQGCVELPAALDCGADHVFSDLRRR